MKKIGRRFLTMAALGLFFLSMFYVGRAAAFLTLGDNVNASERARCVVIDAGHGGDDPGKVGINGANEKDVNLQIAMLLKQYLEANDIRVVMTREDNDGLYDPEAPNKKVQDMKNRIALIDEVSPALTVSIHQNSYPIKK